MGQQRAGCFSQVEFGPRVQSRRGMSEVLGSQNWKVVWRVSFLEGGF